METVWYLVIQLFIMFRIVPLCAWLPVGFSVVYTQTIFSYCLTQSSCQLAPAQFYPVSIFLWIMHVGFTHLTLDMSPRTQFIILFISKSEPKSCKPPQSSTQVTWPKALNRCKGFLYRPALNYVKTSLFASHNTHPLQRDQSAVWVYERFILATLWKCFEMFQVRTSKAVWGCIGGLGLRAPSPRLTGQIWPPHKLQLSAVSVPS